jgi:hypothetical protein
MMSSQPPTVLEVDKEATGITGDKAVLTVTVFPAE